MAGTEMGAVFRVPEFRVVWAAELFSVAGDQLARVALAVLVYGRTGSAAWAAATYALTFLPALLGGVLLSGLADRYRRREVMITSDLLRALLVAAMAIPQLPLWALCSLLVLVVLLGSPHTAAQGALLPEILRGELYERGLAVRQITSQTAQLVGFASGGVLVAAISPSIALLGNAVTFALSAVLVRAGVADRPRPGTSGPAPADADEAKAPDTGRAAAGGAPSGAAAARAVDDAATAPLAAVEAPTVEIRAADAVTEEIPAVDASAGGFRGSMAALAEIARDPKRRALVMLAWLVGWYVVPEALAAPYADQLGAGTAVVGLLMAADPLGSVIGAWLFVRYVPSETRARLVGLLAVGAGLPLVLCAFRPGIPVTLVLWGVSGMLSTAYLLQTQASFVRATPDSGRGRAIGVAASGIIAAQGAAVLVGGLLADVWDPATAIAVAGAVGALLSLGAAVAWRRANRDEREPAGAAVLAGG